jgi:hypothetical protein
MQFTYQELLSLHHANSDYLEVAQIKRMPSLELIFVTYAVSNKEQCTHDQSPRFLFDAWILHQLR